VIVQRRESIRAIQLSSHSQLLAACIVVVGGVWTTTATTKGALVTAQRQLKEMQVQRQSAAEERDEMAARLVDAEGRMRAATAEHAEALRRLTQKTRQSISALERIFDEISIDPARLAPRRSTTGRDRPSVKWADRAGARAAPPSFASDAVAPDLARLDALTQLLRTMPLAAPLKDFAVTSPFGDRTDPFSGERVMHEGIDLQAPLHTPVTATAPGRVVFAGRQGAYGLMVDIEHGHGIRTRYAHLDKITVALGQKVELHQKIGLLGATGRASGPHVHYEIRVDGDPHDPLNFLKAASHARDTAQQR
jgi:murein DD-endopeptidase MepM/ murein hydrolase activator NlpD